MVPSGHRSKTRYSLALPQGGGVGKGVGVFVGEGVCVTVGETDGVGDGVIVKVGVCVKRSPGGMTIGSGAGSVASGTS